MNKMEIRKVDSLDSKVLGLIRRTFLRFEAPDYTEEGINTFFAFIYNFEQMKQLNMFGAFFMGELVGDIGVKQHFSHICLFFVEENFQRQGVGRKLWEHILSRSHASTITVNSSPYAVDVYHHLGFYDLNTEQLTDGIRYTPMRFKIKMG